MYADEGLEAEYDENGVEIRSYGYQPDSIWTTDPLFLKEGDTYYWYQNDHLGTPQKLVDSAGAVVWEAQYHAFGIAQVAVNTIENNLRFPGQYEDAETGLYYNYYRYYDPGVGRYLRTDPIGFDAGDVNLYAYVWNNPVNWVDPFGLVIINYSDYPGQVFKTVTGVDVIIHEDGSIELITKTAKQALGQSLIGGWKDLEWNLYLIEIEKDEGWNALFEKSLKASKEICERSKKGCE